MQLEKINEIIELQKCYQICADILGEIIKLSEKIETTEDELEIEKIKTKVEEKTGLYIMQMLKINSIGGK